MPTAPDNPWLAATGGRSGPAYAARFAALAAAGHDVDGEARRVHALLGTPADVLDAGCGTGRVGIALARWGHRVVGVDLDPSMLAEARRAAPEATWVDADLATLALDRRVDAVVAAGNLWPYLTPGTHEAVLERLAAHLRAGGLLVAGFALDAGLLSVPLPAGTAMPGRARWDAAAAAAGLDPVARWADWAGERAHRPGDGYVVTVDRRPTGGAPGPTGGGRVSPAPGPPPR